MEPPPVFLPGKSHGQRSLEGKSPWCRKRVRHNLVTAFGHLLQQPEKLIQQPIQVRAWYVELTVVTIILYILRQLLGDVAYLSKRNSREIRN